MAETPTSQPVSSAQMRRQMLAEFWFYFSENRGAVIGLFVFVALASKNSGFDRKPQACPVDAVACEVGMKTCFAHSCSVFACVFVLLGLVRRRTRDKISLLLAGNSWGERFLACARTFTLREGLEGGFKVSAT